MNLPLRGHIWRYIDIIASYLLKDSIWNFSKKSDCRIYKFKYKSNEKYYKSYFAIFCTFWIILFSRPDFFFLILIRSNNTKSVSLIPQNSNLINFQKYLIDIGNILKNILGQSQVRNILAFLLSNQTGLPFLYS